MTQSGDFWIHLRIACVVSVQDTEHSQHTTECIRSRGVLYAAPSTIGRNNMK